jgi:hypothetical protein
MKLLDTYALATGSKIDKPYIYEKYFPLPFDKYITLQAQSKYESKDYDYWQDVINLLAPICDKKGYRIIQVGGPNERMYQHVVDLRGRTEVGQLAYIINRSALHIGPDSLGIHIASAADVPLVGLYSVSQSTVSGPHFGSPEKQILFDGYLRIRNKKPSYAPQEYPKSINTIMPEEIVDAAFKLLGWEERSPVKTIYIGTKYGPILVREFVPTAPLQITDPNAPVEIRMDIKFDEKVLEQQLNLCKGVVVTNKRIDKEVLKRSRRNLAALVYLIEADDDPKFIQDIKDIAVPIHFVSRLTSEEVEAKKIKYYEYGKITLIERETDAKIEELRKDLPNLFFRSNKIVLDDGKYYANESLRNAKLELESDFSYQEVIDSPEFWRDLPFMRIVKPI